jgi:hypothetical protein
MLKWVSYPTPTVVRVRLTSRYSDLILGKAVGVTDIASYRVPHRI